MSVRVLFFGMIATRLGQRERMVPATHNMTLATLVSMLDCAGIKPLLLAVNQQQVSDPDLLINDGDEVAIMPPFSGG